MTKVSIIIPAYNSARYIGESIASALKQSFPVLEVIVIDDGSTDETFQIAKSFARVDRRVKVLQQENGGEASARNLGLSEAREI